MEINEGLQKTYNNANQELKQIGEYTSKLTVTDNETYALAGDKLSFLKTMFEELEEERTGLTKPLLDTKAKIDAKYAPLKDAIKSAQEALENKMKGYIRAEDERKRKIAEELRKNELEAITARQAEAEKEALRLEAIGDTEGAKNTIEIAEGIELYKDAKTEQGIKTKSISALGGESVTTSVKKWKGVIVNPALIPAEYYSPDQKKIDLAVKNGVREIKGVLIEIDYSIRTR